MPPNKRKQSKSLVNNDSPQQPKRPRPDQRRFHPNAQQAEDFGIVLREFYPPEMSNERCIQYGDGTLERPIEQLQRAYEESLQLRQSIGPGAAVVHWFKSDLRLHDNRALQNAYQTARDNDIPLICLYILSPEDLTAHLCSAPRVDLTLRTLTQLKRDLEEIDIPLYMETRDSRRVIPTRIVELCRQWGANHLFANLEYEVDELRREAKLVRLGAENGVKVETVHDTCIVTPGRLFTQQGKQYAVYTPWYRSWVAFVRDNPDYLELSDEPGPNPGNPREHYKGLFECNVPAPPANKKLSDRERDYFRTIYPAGEHESLARLDAFLEEKAKSYHDMRNFVSGSYTSILSPYFASGALSARTAVTRARRANGNQLDRGQAGYAAWISEVAWRDFYKHVLVHWPFIW